MSISIYDQLIAPAKHGLTNLDKMLTIGEKYAADNSIDPALLVQARLHLSMLPLVFQVRIATDIVKGAAARLTGTPIPKWEDDEETMADLHARVKKAQDFLGTFKPQQFEGSEKRKIELKLRQQEVTFKGTDYITTFVIPNFYFHLTTAYAILRNKGVPLGKADFLGDIL